MPSLKFVCPVCSGNCFYFTNACTDKNHPHGAVCSVCGTRVTARACLPKKRHASRTTV